MQFDAYEEVWTPELVQCIVNRVHALISRALLSRLARRNGRFKEKRMNVPNPKVRSFFTRRRNWMHVDSEP
jgi:hypothetical protein